MTDDRPRVKAGQAYRIARGTTRGPKPTMPGDVGAHAFVADEKPADLPLRDARGVVWHWCDTKYAPPLDEVELVRPYNDLSILGTYGINGESSFTKDEERIAAIDERPGMIYAGAIKTLFPRAMPPSWEALSLSQHATNMLIVQELLDACLPEERDQLLAIATSDGEVQPVVYNPPYSHSPHPRREIAIFDRSETDHWPAPRPFGAPRRPENYRIVAQRGGIHSEPLVRVFMYRLRGRRDIDFDFEAALAAHEATISDWNRRRRPYEPPIQNIPRPGKTPFVNPPASSRDRYNAFGGAGRSQAEQRASVSRGLAEALGRMADRSPIVNPITGGKKR